MEISTSSNIVTINGNIKNLADHQAIKETIDKLVSANKTIKIKITDSISIISSVIGYLNKLVCKDGVNLSIDVGNTQLKELFDDLNLTTLFKVKKV